MQHTIVINAIDELPSVAQRVIELFEDKKIIAFYGPMGSGKTTFIKALCLALGVKDVVSSPTFALVNQYHSKNGTPIFHFDFYRINSLNEAYDIGYEDYFYSNNFCFIEWSEKIAELLPEDAVKISIKADNTKKRTLEVRL